MARYRRCRPLVLLLVAVVATGALFLASECDDGCPPACEDCLACGLVASETTPPTLASRLTSTRLSPPLALLVPSSVPRQLDHVPLRGVA